MEALQSPTDKPAILQFDMGSQDDEMPLNDIITPKVYFYTEDDELKSKMFPQSWYE